jgi:ATP:ADP antiporter, AAA family
VIIERRLRLQPGEGRLLLLFGALMFSNALAMQISYVASVSGFLKADGLAVVWVVWLVNYGGFLLFAAAQTLFIDRFRRVTLMRGLMLYFATGFALIWLALQLALPGRLSYGALYLLAEQQWMLFPVFFWVFANDSVHLQQAKRLFPLMASIGLVGKLVGLGVATLAPVVLPRFGIDLSHLLLVNLALYLFALTLPQRLRRAEPEGEGELVGSGRSDQEGFWKQMTGGIEFIRSVPAFRHLAQFLFAVMIVDTLIEFYFLAVTDAYFVSQAAYQSFYGAYRIVLVLTIFAMQAFFTRRVLARYPLPQVLSVQPFVAFGVVSLLIMLPGIITSVLALFLLRLTTESFHDSAAKTVQGLIPQERRGRATLILETVVISAGTIVGALVLGALSLATDPSVVRDASRAYLTFAFTIAAAATFFAKGMRESYDASLLSWRLKRRERTGASVLDKLL